MIRMTEMLLSLALFLTGCSSSVSTDNTHHSRGEMAGEVTASSVILQSRLNGTAWFQISENTDFTNAYRTVQAKALPENDFIIKVRLMGLSPSTRYYYRLVYTLDGNNFNTGPACTFRTLAGPENAEDTKFVVVTGMNYGRFHHGDKNRPPYSGPDKHLGYPALKTIGKHKPDFLVGTGDNVYYDFPKNTDAKNQQQMRKKYHQQFSQPRFIELFRTVPTYWQKDDHDHRYNDCDNQPGKLPSSQLGIKIFKEQLPVTSPLQKNALTYRTHRISKDLQIWLVEGRDYRTNNNTKDSPAKTIWGETQKQWLKDTLLKSDAAFKILISPTPMIGPDDAYKKDNHTNPKGFRQEGKEFFDWLKRNGFLTKNFYIICGDRHWQYHSIHPHGFEEFSCGALVDANARIGRLPGDPKSTDPNAQITQPYCMQKPSGGFLEVTVKAGNKNKKPSAKFDFFDEKGILLYSTTKEALQ